MILLLLQKNLMLIINKWKPNAKSMEILILFGNPIWFIKGGKTLIIDKVKKVNEKEEKRTRNEKAADMMIGKWVKCDQCK